MPEVVLPHIHISDVRYFKACRTKWYFGSALRRGLSPITPSRSLYMGTLVHAALDLWYNPENELDIYECLKEVWKQEQMGLDPAYTSSEEGHLELIDLFYKAIGILKNYTLWAAEHDQDFVPVDTEMDFVVPLIPQYCLAAGRIDAIVADRKTGELWVMDHKTTSADFAWYSRYLSTLDEQAKMYVWAAKQVFKAPVKGIIFNLIRNKAPTEPQHLKTGGLSRNKSLDTTWEVYRDALREYGYDPRYYEDMRLQLLQRNLEKPFISRIQITFPDRALAMFEQQLGYIALQMLDEDLPIYPQPSFMNCRGCPFTDPCQALHSESPQSAEMLLQTGYGRGRYVQDVLELQDTTQYVGSTEGV